MKNRLVLMWIVLIAAWTLSGAGVLAAQTITQTIRLQPGWNAIFLEIQPEPGDPAAVFDGLPLDSAWTWLNPGSSVEFIQNPSEGLINQPGWLVYFPDEKRSFLTSLHAVFANTAYLLKLNSDAPVDWKVTGNPVPYKVNWKPDAFNLTGFSVSSINPPTFKAFLSGSPAHEGQSVYDLNARGEWERVADLSDRTVQPGRSYWVYCQGASEYGGPLTVRLSMAGRLEYGAILTEQTVTLENHSDFTRTVSAAVDNSAMPLHYRKFNPGEGYYEWLPLEGMPAISIEGGRRFNLKLGVRRGSMAPGLVESVLNISDDFGTLIRVPVSVIRIGN